MLIIYLKPGSCVLLFVNVGTLSPGRCLREALPLIDTDMDFAWGFWSLSVGRVKQWLLTSSLPLTTLFDNLVWFWRPYPRIRCETAQNPLERFLSDSILVHEKSIVFDDSTKSNSMNFNSGALPVWGHRICMRPFGYLVMLSNRPSASEFGG